jgi:hypothetical protein
MSDYEITPDDEDPGNVILRAGYLAGLATRTQDEDDRLFLQKASRSLRAYAQSLLQAAVRGGR